MPKTFSRQDRIKARQVCRYHCVPCDLCFVGLDAFDAHIGAPGEHYDPADCRHLAARGQGQCKHRVPRDRKSQAITLWEFSRDANARGVIPERVERAA